MRHLSQVLIIFGVWLISDFISRLFHLPIPGNVLSVIFMFLLLYFNIIKYEQISSVSNFLLNNMTFFFVPGTVGIIAYYSLISKQAFAFFVTVIGSSLMVFLATAGTACLLTKLLNKNVQPKEDSDV